jgi:hypothetical protein
VAVGQEAAWTATVTGDLGVFNGAPFDASFIFFWISRNGALKMVHQMVHDIWHYGA